MLLVVNAGSSSVKIAVFDADLNELARAQVAEISAGAHGAALGEALAQCGVQLGDMAAIAHRVVHGGAALTAPCQITKATLAQIAACIPLAPLHNPANLEGIQAMAVRAPGLPQFASFDTAFHATNPDVATRYSIPAADAALGIRRYGFHGLSYAGLVKHLSDPSGLPLPQRLLALHLGNGASLCAILDGRSIATTMGYSPLDGLTMGTRAGSIDGNAVLRLVDVHGANRAAHILDRESGLQGLGGHSDMRALHAADTPEARFAVDHFCYWAVRHAGSMIAAMGGLDAVAFTGGIGENDPVIRGRIMAGLGWAGDVPQHIVPAEEERVIAAEALTLFKTAR